MGIKVLAALFAIFALRRVVIRYRKGYTLIVEFVFWSLVFSGIAVVAFVPQKTDRFAQWLGVSTGFNLLTFLAILGLIFSVYRLTARLTSAERDLTLLVRAQAIAGASRVAPQPVAESRAVEERRD